MKRFTQIAVVLGAIFLSMALIAAVLTGARAAGLSTVNGVDLSIGLNAPQHVLPGGSYIANIAYSNLGDLDSPSDTQLTLLLPEGVGFLSAVDRQGNELPPDSIIAGLLTWEVGSVPAGECCQHIFASLSVDQDLPEGQELALLAEISSSADEADLTNNTSTVLSLICDMAGSTKQVHAGEVKPGDVLSYTLQLRLAQRGSVDSLQQRFVTLVDTIAAQHQVRFLGWNGPISGDWDGHTLRWQGMVQAGEPLTLQYQFGVEGDTPPGAVISNTAKLTWGNTQLDLGPVMSIVVLPDNAQMVGPLGYTWQIQEGLTVEIPPGVVQEMTRFEFQFFSNGVPPEEAPPGYMFAHQFFELNAFLFGEQHQFNEPVRLILRLGSEEIAELKREALRLWYRNGPGEPWAMLDEPTWLSFNTMVFETEHFTQFALFAKSPFQVFFPLTVRH